MRSPSRDSGAEHGMHRSSVDARGPGPLNVRNYAAMAVLVADSALSGLCSDVRNAVRATNRRRAFVEGAAKGQPLALALKHALGWGPRFRCTGSCFPSFELFPTRLCVRRSYDNISTDPWGIQAIRLYKSFCCLWIFR